MSMLQPNSKFPFGMYKGRAVMEIAESRPDYLCWLRQTGFSDFGKEVTEAIFAWEELNPDEVEKIKKSVARKKKEEAAATELEKKRKSFAAADDDEKLAPLHDPMPPPVIPKEARPDWGSW